MPPNPDPWCCPSKAKSTLCKAALGKPLGEETCHSMGCYRYFLDQIKRKRDKRKAKEAIGDKEAQEKFNRKKALERSDRQTQEWFNKRKREMRNQRKAQEEFNQREKERREREWARQQEKYREQQEQAQRDRNQFPPPLVNSGSNQNRSSQPSGNVWAGVSAGMRDQAKKLKDEFDTWNRNFPNQKKEYPLWIQKFFGRGI